MTRVALRLLFFMDFHQHVPQRDAVAEFLSTNRVEVYLFLRRIVRGIDENFRNLREIDIKLVINKPPKVAARFSKVGDVRYLPSVIEQRSYTYHGILLQHIAYVQP